MNYTEMRLPKDNVVEGQTLTLNVTGMRMEPARVVYNKDSTINYIVGFVMWRESQMSACKAMICVVPDQISEHPIILEMH